jgi:hypothetical protein
VAQRVVSCGAGAAFGLFVEKLRWKKQNPGGFTWIKRFGFGHFPEIGILTSGASTITLQFCRYVPPNPDIGTGWTQPLRDSSQVLSNGCEEELIVSAAESPQS